MQRLFHWFCGFGIVANNRLLNLASCLLISLMSAAALYGQTAQTGALTGTVSDPTGRVVQGVTVTVTSTSTGQTRTAVTQSNGKYLVPLLPPDVYKVEISSKDFKTVVFDRVKINITETAAVNAQLQIGSFKEIMTITAEPEQLNVTDTTLGHVTDQRVVENLPMATRNYTQILGLSPGVSGDVNNSAHIGRGDSSLSSSTGGYSIAGGSTNDNNFQMNGTEVNDLAGESLISGGVPVPNPDSIQEFKVQVGQYDASYGRNAGANVDVVTKSGTNEYHGDVWEYFRNTALNANDYFLNRNNLPRGVLNQNQFGGTFGGPILKNKVMFFASYQGTRERDGLDNSVGCLSTGLIPPQFGNSPDKRTADALATTFQGEQGFFSGQINSAADISPTALAVLNAQLPNGQLVVPGSQDSSGNITLSAACVYRDDQFVSNLDFYHTDKSHFSGKFFWMNSNSNGAFPQNQLGVTDAVSVPGFPRTFDNKFRDLSLTHTYAFNDHFLNQAIIGFHRLAGGLGQNYPKVGFANTPACPASVPGPLTLASLCVPAPAFDNPFPDILIAGGGCALQGSLGCPAAFNFGGNGQGVDIFQNYYDLGDSLTYVRGKHSLHFGGGLNRTQINFRKFHFFGGLYFLDVPDFLLGQPFLSIDVPGVFDRDWKVWDGNAYVQDNYQIVSGLTLNLGFRYERQGQLGDYSGRASTFDPSRANPNPPDAGTLQGFIVGSNFSGGTIPAGVIRSGNNTAINNDGQNAFEPRVGFAWQLPGAKGVVLRGGYGLFVTRTTSEPFIQLLGAPPWGIIRQLIWAGVPNPIPQAFPTAPPFPIFTPYAPPTSPAGTDLTPTVFSVHFRPPILQRYSVSLQTAISNNWMFELGYQGSRGTKLLQSRSFNQALPASPNNPVHGQTDLTLANLLERVPILGFDPAFSTIIESAGASWYNALGASVSKRFSHGLQLLASYTWASALETNPGYTTGGFAGGARTGDQNSARANYGFDGFVRPQRFIVSYVYELPGFKSGSGLKTRVLGGWSVAGVATFQNGQKMTITETNSLNAFGIVNGQGDRAQLAPGCNNQNLVTRGSVTAKIDNYFNTSCFTLPPIIGDPEPPNSCGQLSCPAVATAFGNSGNGIVSGPDQRNFDISAIKKIPFTESKSLEFRAEFFNAFNTPSFSNPSLNAGTVATTPPPNIVPVFQPDSSFGHITSTSVAPRIIQFALKLYF
jgi:outer membrane receptor protein involved in Fe transport